MQRCPRHTPLYVVFEPLTKPHIRSQQPCFNHDVSAEIPLMSQYNALRLEAESWGRVDNGKGHHPQTQRQPTTTTPATVTNTDRDDNDKQPHTIAHNHKPTDTPSTIRLAARTAKAGSPLGTQAATHGRQPTSNVQATNTIMQAPDNLRPTRFKQPATYHANMSTAHTPKEFVCYLRHMCQEPPAAKGRPQCVRGG